MAALVKLEYRFSALSTYGLNRGGANCLIIQGATSCNSHTGNVCNVVVALLIALPRGIMALLQVDWMGSEDETRLIDVPGTVTSGSLNNIAVAGIVRGTINPESIPKPELNTAITIAPGKPETNSATSDATDSI